MRWMQLWKIAKYSYQEAFIDSEIQMAGSNQAKLLEQMEKNKNYMKAQGIAMKIVVMLYIFGMIFIPIQAFTLINQASNAGISPKWVLFAGTITLGIFSLMQVLYLVMFGLFFTSSLLSGEALQWLATLPFSQKDLQKIGLLTFFKGIDAQTIALFLTLPIGVAVGSQSLGLTLLAIPLSLANLVVSFSFLVIIGERVERVLFSTEQNTRRNTAMRLLVMVGYSVVTLVVAFGLQYAFGTIGKFYSMGGQSASSPELLNAILPIIPFPFNSAFILMAARLSQPMPVIQWITTMIGVGLFALLVKGSYTRALGCLAHITKKKKIVLPTAEISPTQIEDIQLLVTGPVDAFFHKDRHAATRYIQMLMMIIMPLILPAISYLSVGFAAGDEIPAGEMIYMTLSLNSLYVIMSAAMIIWGVLNAESTGASILGSLPILVRDQAKAKIRWLFLLLPIATLLPSVFDIGSPVFLTSLAVNLILIPIGPITGILILELKCALFGKLRYKYVLEEVNIAGKTLKWILIFVITTFIYIGVFVGSIACFIGDPEITPHALSRFALIFLAGEAIATIIVWGIFNRMFPKAKIYEYKMRINDEEGRERKCEK